MTDQNRAVVLEVYRQLLVRSRFYQDRPGAAEAFADDLEGIPGHTAEEAAFALYSLDPTVTPNGMMVRRRVARRFGVLAPSWGEALKLRRQARDRIIRLRDLPGPVVWHVPVEALDAKFDKPYAEAYADAADEHDVAVLRRGGFRALVGIGAEFDLAWELEDLTVEARRCQVEMGEPPTDGPMSREEALAVKARFEARPKELAGSEDGPWTPARVRAAAAGAGPFDPTVALR